MRRIQRPSPLSQRTASCDEVGEATHEIGKVRRTLHALPHPHGQLRCTTLFAPEPAHSTAEQSQIVDKEKQARTSCTLWYCMEQVRCVPFVEENDGRPVVAVADAAAKALVQRAKGRHFVPAPHRHAINQEQIVTEV